MTIRIAQFAAVVLTALAIVPGGAHLLELSAKLALDREQYLTVQQIYRGWALLGVVIVAAIAANVVLARLSRVAWAWAAAGILAATLIVFFGWTFPVNRATENWSLAPADWQALRLRWEFSHAVNFALTFAAFCCAVASALTGARAPR